MWICYYSICSDIVKICRCVHVCFWYECVYDNPFCYLQLPYSVCPWRLIFPIWCPSQWLTGWGSSLCPNYSSKCILPATVLGELISCNNMGLCFFSQAVLVIQPELLEHLLTNYIPEHNEKIVFLTQREITHVKLILL